jgi:hypothetical protein
MTVGYLRLCIKYHMYVGMCKFFYKIQSNTYYSREIRGADVIAQVRTLWSR